MFWWVFAWAVMIGSDLFWLPGRYAALASICCLLCWLAAVERRQEKGGLACAKRRLKSAPCAKFTRLTIRKAQRALAVILEVSAEFADVRRRDAGGSLASCMTE
jgi:hypothetical protein